jgi:hypothetical protein
MNRLIGTLATILTLGQIVVAQSQSVQLQPAVRPRFEDILAKSVVRITVTAEGVHGELNGTGFLVEVPEPRTAGDRVAIYLVTNRHVAKAMTPDEHGKDIAHKILTARAVLNRKEPFNGDRFVTVPLPPEEQQVTWYFPTDDSIDLAIVGFHIKDEYDVTRLAPSFFFTHDKWPTYRIGPGDKVLTCGYFVHYAGSHQFQPIIREGSFAMEPDDVMAVPIGGKAKVYLADLHIIRGNSGSPLFLAPGFTMGGHITDSNGGIPYGLLGIVSGFMYEDSQLTLHPANDFEGTLHANSGIAMIVPVDQLKDLLDAPEVQKERDAAFEDYHRQHSQLIMKPQS